MDRLILKSIIDQLDISLTPEETKILSANSFQYQLSQEEIQRIFKKTEDWIISQQLIWQALVKNHDLDELLEKKSEIHIEQLDEEKKLVEFLNLYGYHILKRGKIEILHNLLVSLNANVKNKHPFLWSLFADVKRQQCRFSESIADHQTAKILATKNNLKDDYIRSLVGEARVYLDTVQPSKAEPLLKEALRLGHRMERFEELSTIYALYSENQLNLGNTKIAEKLYKLSLKQQHEESLGNIEARLHLRTGRFRSALKLLEEKKEQETKLGKTNIHSHHETSVLLAIIFSFMGQAEEAKRMAQQGIKVGKEFNARFVEAVGWMRLGHATQLAVKDDFSNSLKCYEKALNIMDELSVEKGKVEPLMGLTLLYGFIGELEQAVLYAQQGIQIAERVKDHWFTQIIHLVLGISYAHNYEYNLAKLELMESYQGLSRLGDQFSATVTLMWLGYIALKEQDWVNFEKYTGQFLLLMNQGKYHFLIQRTSFYGPRDLQKFAPFFIEIKKRRLDSQGIVTNWLMEKGWLSLDSHPGYTLRIQMLGKFSVWLGDKQLNDKDWQREKAKQLFQLLVARRFELLPKKFLQDTLWPMHTDEQQNRDFKVALNALNRALEPNRQEKAPTFFIQRHGSSYGLNLVSGYELDIELFEQQIKLGLKEKKEDIAYYLLGSSLELYSGEFLPEQFNEPWTIEERERLQLLYLRGAEKIAKIELQRKNFPQAISWGERIITLDPTWEEAYRIMLIACKESGDRSLALKLFQKCKQVLHEELGVEPMPQILEIYQSLFQHN